ncbi:MAG TPA: hypothetical protein VLX91_09700 [Candidatus Acidoferrales bacterium]|nr:hypothetical protein [Candidatus Acidoferrales bacterium]
MSFRCAIKYCAIFSAIFYSETKAQSSDTSSTAFDFSGYVVDMPIYQNLHASSNSEFADLARLRLRPILHIGNNTKIGAEYEIDGLYYSQNSSFVLASTTPMRQVISLHWQPIAKNHLAASHYIDRLYFDQDFSFGSLVIGRQRISWGTGRVWNPTDIFNPINPANFGKIEKDGSDAASLKFDLGQLTNLQLVYNAEYHFKYSDYAARFHTNIFDYDFSLMTGYVDKRLVDGGDFAGDIGGAGVRGEALVSSDILKHTGYFIKWILGADYQFTDKLYGLLEYYHNGQGALDRINYDLIDLYEGRILNVAKDYLVVTGSYQLSPLTTVSLSSNSNFNDGSGYLAGTFAYSASDNTSITLGTLYTYGKPSTEYWYYPQAYYIKLESYF